MGLYGVMAYVVARRTREIGIRMALGASGGSVVWLVMREVLPAGGDRGGHRLPGGVGPDATGAGAVVRHTGRRPWTMVAAAVGIASVAAISGLLPARRATTIDPMLALRWD